jgi:response regulator NasT
VSAYVVDGVRQEHVKPILDMAVSRFNAFSRMAREVEEDPQQAREPQGDRPRGLLMKSRRLSADTAYALLRKSVMKEPHDQRH